MTTELSEILHIGTGNLVSIVGAGGKTTTMYRLCHELAARGLRVISTTTTVIQRPTPRQSPLLILEAEAPDLLLAAREALGNHGHITVAGEAWRVDKLKGVSAGTAARLLSVADAVITEADGARHNRIKAPAEHEPVVPAETTHFLSVAGLHALGHPLVEVCHRPELAAAIAEQPLDSTVTVETLARLLGCASGGLKGRPEGAAAWALLTHLTDGTVEAARAVACRLQGYTGVIALSPGDTLRLA